MKVYLIGMPGSGKTTLGKLLARALKVPFVDLDEQIEQREGVPVKQIFEEKGEDYFRRTESANLKEWAKKDNSFVMATGGGAPCFFNGIDIINETGVSVFLNVPVSELIKRLDKDEQRPLLQRQQASDLEHKLQALYDKRLNIYHKAHITVDGNATPEHILTRLQGVKK